MAAIKQRLTQKMSQKLSPQQIQLMKLLQIPTATLEQRIKEELEANPALDEGDLPEEDGFGAEKAIRRLVTQFLIPAVYSWVNCPLTRMFLGSFS